MKVKDILKDVLIFINKSEYLGLNTFDTLSQTAPTIAQQADIDMLTRCFNYVYKEIAICYLPLLYKEKLNFVDNKIEISSFTKSLISVKKITKNNKKLKFYIFPTYIYSETDSAEIVYSYLPEDLTITSDVDAFGGRVITQVLAYGVAREYNFFNGDYPEAEMWNTKFVQAISQVSTKNITILPRRRFR